jgi:sulfate adenylyltransferase subunit 2
VTAPLPPHLASLEAESIEIFREVVAECERPVLLYSVGKDSAVLLHLARKAFYPDRPPFPLLHIATGWDFRDVLAMRDAEAARLGFELIVQQEPASLSPLDTSLPVYIDTMLTGALRNALDRGGFDAAFGGARRDEERSRAKERILSIRSPDHGWNPRNQRPELWRLFNTRKQPGETIRAFPLSNWTELDVWRYIALERIPVVPLYLAAPRPVIERDGLLLMIDDDRLPLRPGEEIEERMIRFRTLGDYPLTGAIESQATTVEAVIAETQASRLSERAGRAVDHDQPAGMERKKAAGYF